MWKVRVTSTGKEMGEAVCTALSSLIPPTPPPSSLPMDSVLLELEIAAASKVGCATFSMNSSKLCVSLMCSGRDSTTADRERTPRFTGRPGRTWASPGGEGCRSVGVAVVALRGLLGKYGEDVEVERVLEYEWPTMDL